jgi:acyl-homoserine lactone acylase PvdQ
MRPRFCRTVLATAAALLAAAPAAWAAAPKDYAGTALNIIPSGQYGSFPAPPQADQQAKMYDALTPLFDKVTNADLQRDFKSERLGTKGQCPCAGEKVPRSGVTVVRDRYHVPHITGKTVDDVTWGAGWVTAEDRALLLEQARYNSRVAAIDAPGLSAIGLVQSLRSFVPSARTEAVVARQTTVLRAAGRKGRALLHDIDVYISGINAYLRSTNSPNKPWTRNDVYALNALKGQFLGQGGGDEVRRSMLLAGLEQRLGAAKGFSVFDDLRQRDPADHPTTIGGRFPYGAVPRSRSGNAIADPGSYTRWDYGSAAAAAAVRDSAAVPKQYASNVLIVGGKRSATGHPLFVGGPQIGYFYPGLTLEMDLKGPGFAVRGATSAPFPGYMLIGRGQDFAWTLTSAGGDVIDQYVETLCGDDTHYRYKGKCRAMDTFDAGVLKGSGGAPDQKIAFRRTVHGPVVGYATVGGKRVAISSKRSTYGRDTLDQLPFQDLTRGRVTSGRSFVKSFLQSPQTFNAFYADNRQMAEVTTGRLPLRAKDVDPGLPTKGDGSHEWRGFLSAKGHPQTVITSGQLVNWNNKTARGFQAADDEWSYGDVQRVDMLNKQLARHRRHTLATVTSAMNAAATQDLRSVDVTPVLAKVLGGGPAPTPRDAQMLQLLRAWRAHGSSRLDRDLDGKVDDPGAAIMDAAWNRIADAVMAPVLGSQLGELATIESRYSAPPGGQSSGWHSYVVKDLRRLLGEKVPAPFHNRYCGGGNLTACRASLWAAIDAAGDELAATQGADPAAWRADATKERITFVPGLLKTTLRYTNRPSGIQQVISFRGHRKAQ